MRHRFTAMLVAVVAVLSTTVTASSAAASQLPTPKPSPPAVLASTAGTVYYWNDLLLELHAASNDGPTVLARADAIVHAAIFDTMNSARWAKQGLTGSGFNGYFTIAVDTAKGVDDDLAVGLVARDLLKELFAGQSARIDAAYASRHGTDTVTSAEQTLASTVMGAYRSQRLNDGADASPVYTPDGVPGAWRPTDGCTVVA
uniref:hypothetical protein n=1 Tax=Antribacter gilvus TaxID=2304675 RepID=UPI00197DE0B5